MIESKRLIQLRKHIPEIAGGMIGITLAVSFFVFIIIPTVNNLTSSYDPYYNLHGCTTSAIGIVCVHASKEVEKQACMNQLLSDTHMTLKQADDACTFFGDKK